MSVYDQRGQVQRVDAHFKKPLSAEPTVIFGAGYVRQSTIFGIAGLWDNASIGYASAGLERASGPLSWSVKAIQGLGARARLTCLLPAGRQDGAFTAAPAEARYQWEMGSG